MDIGCKAQEAFKRGNEARGERDNEFLFWPPPA